MIEINGDKCHATLMKKITPSLAYNDSADYDEWKAQIEAKLRELTGIDLIAENACEPELTVEEDIHMDGYRRIRFVFYSEIDAMVPCYLLIPDTNEEKYPLMITLQGHTSGMHISLGIEKYPGDEVYSTGSAFALQAVKNGFAALCIEQRSMGERKPPNPADRGHGCCYQAHNAFMLGRTTIGERAWDVSRALDLMTEFAQIDTERVAITGNSGGGTATFYAACLDKRIKAAIPSCSFCPYTESIMAMLHCGCNYIPSAFRYFDMEDLTCLIAPRKLLIINGERDDIFLFEGTKRAFETVKKIYSKAGAENNCKLIGTPEGHLWMPEVVWPAIDEFIKL